jgi:uncharacterized protein (TIGR03084 family)
VRRICDDLQAEHESLDALVAGLEPARWDTPTPAEGWTVRDQIAHLSYSDVSARLAVVDAETWQREFHIDRAEREQRQRDVGLSRTPAELLAWWRQCRSAMLAAFRPLDRRTRIPWFGPPMSALTFATARLEETWGHGQDVADALGVRRSDTDRLRHVAHLGVLTRTYSFVNQGRPAPNEDVRVELTGPSGEKWTWGDPASANRVTGSARSFCLVVTRRRHIADTDLVTEGDAARDWVEIAQAFAGPPGSGRRPGQFPRD